MVRRAAHAALALVTWLAAGAALAAGIKVEGSLPRNLAQGSFRMLVTISGVKTEEYNRGAKDPADPVEALKARFNVKLKEVDSSNELPVRPDDVKGDLTFYLSEYADHTEAQSGDTWTYVYSLQVTETAGGALKTKAGTDRKMTVAVSFFLGGDTKAVAEEAGKVLAQDFYIATATPAFDAAAPLAGTHKALRVYWDPVETVAVKGGSDAERPASLLNVYLVDPDRLVTADLPARHFSGSADAEDAAATCAFALPGPDGGACVSCGTDVYLDRARLESEVAGLTVTTASVADGAVTLGGLENGKRYYAFLQYQPDGLGVTTCLPGVPSPNFSLTELNGEGDARIVDVRCFIATAAYGSPLGAELDRFRRFRDETLLKTPGGPALVAAYYELSPPVARFIARHPRLRAAARDALATVADWIGPAR